MATILYVGHDEMAQQLIQASLGHQYNVVTTSSGPTAVQYCAMIQPDLIVIDLALTDIDRPELIARLKAFMPQTPVVVIGAEHSRQAISRADSFLPKPLDGAALKRTIQAFIPPPVKLPELVSTLPEHEVVEQFEGQIAALNQANKQLASLNAVSALVGTSLDLEHLTDEILTQIEKTVDFDSATLFLLKGNLLEAAASRGLSDYRQGMNIYRKKQHNSAWQVVQNKLPMIIGDVTTSPLWEPRPELGQVRSWLGVPLIHKDRVVGVLTLDKNEADAFTDADARYIFTLAFQIAIAVENTQLFEQWEDQSTRLKLINQVAQEINTFLDVDDLFQALARAISGRLHYKRVAILAIDESRSCLILKAVEGRWPAQFKVDHYRQDIQVGLLGRAAQMGQPILLNEGVQTGEVFVEDGLEFLAVLVEPIFVGTQVEAVICVEGEDKGSFGDQDLWTFSSLAAQAGVAIRNAWLYRGLDAYSENLKRTIMARTRRLQAIRKISQVVSQGLEIDELLPMVGQSIGQIFETTPQVQVAIGLVDGTYVNLHRMYGLEDQQAARLWGRLEPKKVVGQVIVQAKARILNNVPVANIFSQAAEGQKAAPFWTGPVVASVLLAPLITGGKTLGLVIVESQLPDAFNESDLETLETLAFQIASAVEHARLLKKTREIAIVEERTRLARDMHDGVAQNLAYLLIQVDRSLNMVEPDSQLEGQLEQLGTLLKQNINELRRNIFDLRPVELEGKSFFAGLENFVAEFGRRWSLQISCVMPDEGVDLPPKVESSLYRILQETLSNAQQHAQCSWLRVTVTLEEGQWVTLEVEDDGRGFAPDRVERWGGLGLISMRERAERIGGRLLVSSEPGEGTRISVRLPL